MRLALFALATQLGCAYAWSGVNGGAGRETRELRPAELGTRPDDARLECDGTPCEAVKLSKSWSEPHGLTSYRNAFLVETGVSAALWLTNRSVGFLELIGVMLSIDGLAAVYGFLTDKFERKYEPEVIDGRALADWRGVRFPLTAGQVVAAEGGGGFSLKAVAGKAGYYIPEHAPELKKGGRLAVRRLLLNVPGLKGEGVSQALTERVRKRILDGAGETFAMMGDQETLERLLRVPSAESRDDAQVAGDLDVAGVGSGAVDAAPAGVRVRLRLTRRKDGALVSQAETACAEAAPCVDQAADKLVEPLRKVADLGALAAVAGRKRSVKLAIEPALGLDEAARGILEDALAGALGANDASASLRKGSATVTLPDGRYGQAMCPDISAADSCLVEAARSALKSRPVLLPEGAAIAVERLPSGAAGLDDDALRMLEDQIRDGLTQSSHRRTLGGTARPEATAQARLTAAGGGYALSVTLTRADGAEISRAEVTCKDAGSLPDCAKQAGEQLGAPLR